MSILNHKIACAMFMMSHFGNIKLQGNSNVKHNPRNNKRTKPKKR